VVTLYHAPFSRSVRVLWLLEELGAPFELRVLPPIAGTTPFSQATPTGKVPTLQDGALVMFESIAIMEYLLDRYAGGRLAPARDALEWGHFLQWLHYSESTAFPPLGYIARHSFALPEPERNAESERENRLLAAKVLAVPERVLGESEYLLGDTFTAADIAMGYTVGTAKLLGLLDHFPNLDAFFGRLAKRPAFQRATGAPGR
jgi:glutathione S-transferase